MVSVNIKDIYNTYLKASGKGLNRPYRIRENFDDFDEGKVGILLKLEHFFKNYNTVTPFDFFYAPYIVLPDVQKTIPLSEYAGMRAIDTYKTYLIIKKEQTPDQQKDDIRESLIWLAGHLKNEGLDLKTYVTAQTEYYPEVLLDYKTNKLNLFVLVALDSMFDIFSKIEKNDIEQIFPNYKKLGFLRSALFSSEVGKKTVTFLRNL